MQHGDLLKAVVITTLAVTLTSCSRNPVAPSTDLSAPAGAGSAAVSVVPETPPADGDGGTPSSRTETFVATSEGVMTVGRWTLWFRKNSLTMPATITMRVTDPEAMDVQIDVQPAAANNFASPVVLTANVSDVNGYDYTTGDMQVGRRGLAGPAGAHGLVTPEPAERGCPLHHARQHAGDERRQQAHGGVRASGEAGRLLGERAPVRKGRRPGFFGGIHPTPMAVR